jgi:hypothetical protein
MDEAKFRLILTFKILLTLAAKLYDNVIGDPVVGNL